MEWIGQLAEQKLKFWNGIPLLFKLSLQKRRSPLPGLGIPFSFPSTLPPHTDNTLDVKHYLNTNSLAHGEAEEIGERSMNPCLPT